MSEIKKIRESLDKARSDEVNKDYYISTKLDRN